MRISDWSSDVCSSDLSSLAGAAPHPDQHGALIIEVLSSAPEHVSGGDALLRVEVPHTVPLHQVTLTLDGVDVTAMLAPAPGEHALVGRLGRASCRERVGTYGEPSVVTVS